ncbi:MAG: hypothetical protein KDA45_00245 [Planctomycetales bacterium]|nr:hypothetical protein [Planctomycetales bacterium]
MKISTAAYLGQILLWLGFIGGALASVFRLEDSAAPWQTIPWGIYIACAAVGVLGVVLLRRDKAAHRLLSASSEDDLEGVLASLQQAAGKVSHFAAQIEDTTCEQVLEFIDEQCAPLLNDFAEGRMVIANRFGTATYAAVMTEFASGERYLNRSWSAAADGYVDEVGDSIRHASVFLTAAERDLRAAIANDDT